jgi:hypothetical protein
MVHSLACVLRERLSKGFDEVVLYGAGAGQGSKVEELESQTRVCALDAGGKFGLGTFARGDWESVCPKSEAA